MVSGRLASGCLRPLFHLGGVELAFEEGFGLDVGEGEERQRGEWASEGCK